MKIQFHIKGETGRSLEQTHLPAQNSSTPDTQTTMDPPEPAPQGRGATVGYVAAAVPRLEQLFLGGGDTLDMPAVPFLLAQSFLQRKRECGEEGDGGGAAETGVRGEDARDQPQGPRRLAVHACSRSSVAALDGRCAWLLLVLLWEEEEEEEEEDAEDELAPMAWVCPCRRLWWRLLRRPLCSSSLCCCSSVFPFPGCGRDRV